MPPSSPSSPANSRVRIDRPGLILAAACWILWFSWVQWRQPTPLVDEQWHQAAIAAFMDGGAPSQALPMLPGYHRLVAVLGFALEPSLFWSRTVTLLLGLAMLAVYARIPRTEISAENDRPRSALPLALLPLALPFSALVYTDIPSLAFVIAAVWAVRTDRFGLSALFAAAACAVRQSNLVWLGLLALLAALRVIRSHGPEGPPSSLWTQLRRTIVPAVIQDQGLRRRLLVALSGYGLVGLGFGLYFVIRGSLLFDDVQENVPHLNPGHLYLFGALTWLLWLPLWVERLPGLWRSGLESARRRQGTAAMVAGIFAGLSWLLFLTYSLPHPWNQVGLFWHNLPLMLMLVVPALRVLGIVMSLAALVLWIDLYRHRPRPELFLLAVFTVLFLLPHGLVEARYFLIPAVLVHLFVDLSARQEARLLKWFALLNVLAIGAYSVGLGMW